MLKFAVNLKYLRELKGLKQSDMLADIGFKQTTWNNYENNISQPGFADLIKISKYFEVLESDLMHLHLAKHDLNEIKARYKNHNKHDLNHDVYHDLNDQNEGKSSRVNEPKTSYNNDLNELVKMKQLLEERNKRIASLEDHIETLKDALAEAKTRLQEHTQSKRKAG